MAVTWQPPNNGAWWFDLTFLDMSCLPVEIAGAVDGIAVGYDGSVLSDVGGDVQQEPGDFPGLVPGGGKDRLMIGGIELSHAHRVHQAPAFRPVFQINMARVAPNVDGKPSFSVGARKIVGESPRLPNAFARRVEVADGMWQSGQGWSTMSTITAPLTSTRKSRITEISLPNQPRPFASGACASNPLNRSRISRRETGAPSRMARHCVKNPLCAIARLPLG